MSIGITISYDAEEVVRWAYLEREGDPLRIVTSESELSLLEALCLEGLDLGLMSLVGAWGGPGGTRWERYRLIGYSNP